MAVWYRLSGTPFLCRLRSIAAHRDHFVRRLSVCACVCLFDSHTFLIVTHSYVSQATHAFLGMLPLCCSFTSVNMTSQRKAQRFPRRQSVPVTLKRTLLACFSLKCIYISRRYEKNNQVPMLNPDRQISVSGDTMSHPSLGYRLDLY